MQQMAGVLQVKESTNQAFPATLTRPDYAPILAFIHSCRASYAISREIPIIPTAVQEFYLNLHRITVNGVETLQTVVNGTTINITIPVIRRILHLGTDAQEAGPNRFPRPFVMGALRRMGLTGEVTNTQPSIKKGFLFGQWRLLAHIVLVVFGTRATGHDELTFEYLSALVALVYNKPTLPFIPGL